MTLSYDHPDVDLDVNLNVNITLDIDNDAFLSLVTISSRKVSAR
jgi:hypothetical protein